MIGPDGELIDAGYLAPFRYLAPRTALAFCVTVSHAEHVAARFRDSGIPAASIDGTMSADERRNLVNRLRTGAIRVLTSCEIISEGFDAPADYGHHRTLPVPPAVTRIERRVVAMLSWPRKRCRSVMSIPSASSRVATVCRSRCG